MSSRPPLIRFVVCLLGSLLLSSPAFARRGEAPAGPVGYRSQSEAVDTYFIPAFDLESLVAEDPAPQPGQPRQFAEPVPVRLTSEDSGTWETLPDGARRWRLRIDAPGATDLNLGFDRFVVPPGTELWVISETHDYWDGPYGWEDVKDHGELWLPVTPGPRVMIEMTVPPVTKFEPEVEIGQVGYGFRDWFRTEAPAPRQGSCNNDVICPEGDPWRDDIASVGVYQLNGSWTCTGTVVNNTSSDFTPYFLTANHCGVSTGNDQTMVVYWNFESPTCGQLSGGSLADNQTGATFRATYSASDFCLVELDDDPTDSGVYWAGWDRSGANPSACTAIHHPSTDEKAISFNTDPLTVTTYLQNPVPGDGTHWRIDDWEDGTTEPGSSGSGIWDPNHRLVGQLHGGFASCSSITSDWYGRVYRSWTGGGSSSNRLSDWLDPGNTGAMTMDGSYPSGIGSLKYDSHAANDDCASDPGNDNGILEPGESVVIPVTLRASGGSHTSISATLTSPTSGITILDGSATWPNIAQNTTAQSDAPHFEIQIDEAVACGTVVDFDLTMYSAEGGPWAASFSETVGQDLEPNGLPQAIPDAGSTTSTFDVGDNVSLTDLNVRVEISHTYVGDLFIQLESPTGTIVTLLDRPGVPASTYGCGDNDMNVTFDDASGLNLETHCAGTTPWYSGVAAPVQALSAFNSESTAGQWKLHVTDNASVDTGSILDWELLTTPAINGVCNVCQTATASPISDLGPDKGFRLAQNHPNPFGPRTEISFHLDRAGETSLDIYDVAGRHVKTLVNRALPVGRHVSPWDGTDETGRSVASGIYFYRLRNAGETQIKRMHLIR